MKKKNQKPLQAILYLYFIWLFPLRSKAWNGSEVNNGEGRNKNGSSVRSEQFCYFLETEEFLLPCKEGQE